VSPTVACVLRTGGVYTADWVWALKRGINRHLPTPYQLLVLTDVAAGFGPWGVQLKYDWPGWWSKLEVFRPGLFEGPVLYLDLDTLPVGDLSEIASYSGRFAMLSDFYRPDRAESGVMAFTPGPETERIWNAFAADPFKAMKQFRQDGKFIAAHSEPVRLQDVFPRQIVSLKVHARQALPGDARLCCAHGRPKFDDPAAGWAHQAWRAA
jgi:hypothetical protein